AMDGTRTPRSAMASQMAKWANAPEQASLWQARPVQGDIGIVVVPESQLFCYAQQGNTDFYSQSTRGAYQGFFENNVQADWVHVEDIDRYAVLYLPFPVHLSGETARRLRAWINGGGTLIAEGLPGYWGDRGRVGTVQPNLGLNRVFGVRETYVEFTPDLLNDLTFEWQGQRVPGGIFLQSYTPTNSESAVVGHYTGDASGPAAGLAAAVEHRFGNGRTLLFGTFPGYRHFHRPSEESRRFFASVLSWAGVTQHVRVQGPTDGASLSGEWRGVTARLHQDTASGQLFLWVTNPARVQRRVMLQLDPRWAAVRRAAPLWPAGAPAVPVEAGSFELEVGDRDAVIAELQRSS
ncbi:MAG TPA: beta-galactosidase trimerization domain-containing protein, partial [Chloroflexota bacterium]|nr:beta-galactosidase trimerization domain-containing protein [Chloroflexota bacterium]